MQPDYPFHRCNWRGNNERKKKTKKVKAHKTYTRKQTSLKAAEKTIFVPIKNRTNVGLRGSYIKLVVGMIPI